MDIEEEENHIKNTLAFKTDYYLADSFDSPHAYDFLKYLQSNLNGIIRF